MFGGHKECEATKHRYVHKSIIDAGHILDRDNYIEKLVKVIEDYRESDSQLLNQIQELKAINHYQAYELEKKIQELEKQITELEAKLKLHHGDSMPVQNKKKEKNG